MTPPNENGPLPQWFRVIILTSLLGSMGGVSWWVYGIGQETAHLQSEINNVRALMNAAQSERVRALEVQVQINKENLSILSDEVRSMGRMGSWDRGGSRNRPTD